MPRAPMHVCAGDPHCPILVPHGQRYCPNHTPRSTWNRQTEPIRLRGRALQRARAELHAREPWCRTCKRPINLDEMVRDHILPLFEGGTEAPDNIQPLCKRCSDTKTHAESMRGKR